MLSEMGCVPLKSLSCSFFFLFSFQLLSMDCLFLSDPSKFSYFLRFCPRGSFHTAYSALSRQFLPFPWFSQMSFFYLNLYSQFSTYMSSYLCNISYVWQSNSGFSIQLIFSHFQPTLPRGKRGYTCMYKHIEYRSFSSCFEKPSTNKQQVWNLSSSLLNVNLQLRVYSLQYGDLIS